MDSAAAAEGQARSSGGGRGPVPTTAFVAIATVAASATLGAPRVAVLVIGALAMLAVTVAIRWPRAKAVAPRAAAAPVTPIPQAMLEEAPVAMILYADAGEIVRANRAARALFFAEEDPAGRSFLDVVQSGPDGLRQLLTADEDGLFTLQAQGLSDVYSVSRTHFEIDGHRHGLLVVKLVTREMARRDVEVLKKTIRIISHELNNSLASMSSLLHSARVIALDPKPELLPHLDRALQTADGRAQHLKTFLSGYAQLARLPRPARKRVDVAGFASGLRNLFPWLAITLDAEVGHFDPTQIEQVLVNVIKNAEEAGGPQEDITLVIQRDGADPAALAFVLRDRGPGLAPEALEHAAEPFFTTKATGSGLGLALSRDIVEAHGGSLSLGNRDGGGAEVRFRLPGTGPVNLFEHLSRSAIAVVGRRAPRPDSKADKDERR